MLGVNSMTVQRNLIKNGNAVSPATQAATQAVATTLANGAKVPVFKTVEEATAWIAANMANAAKQKQPVRGDIAPYSQGTISFYNVTGFMPVSAHPAQAPRFFDVAEETLKIFKNPVKRTEMRCKAFAYENACIIMGLEKAPEPPKGKANPSQQRQIWMTHYDGFYAEALKDATKVPANTKYRNPDEIWKEIQARLPFTLA